tara:strand:- start:80 stop:388 length:309 start_codon:yes stop_codon:yes gene_type:complete
MYKKKLKIRKSKKGRKGRKVANRGDEYEIFYIQKIKINEKASHLSFWFKECSQLPPLFPTFLPFYNNSLKNNCLYITISIYNIVIKGLKVIYINISYKDECL